MTQLPVDVPSTGESAPPRSNGELVFSAPWEGRAFGLCIAILERRGLSWDDFRPYLVDKLAEEPERPYYDSFVLALDQFAGVGVETPGWSADTVN